MSRATPITTLTGLTFTVGAGLLFLGCCPAPPPAAPAPAPTAAPAAAQTEAAPPASAPVVASEPDCGSTLKACKSTDQTRLAIKDTAGTFHPPNGWNYAKEAEQSVAFSPDRTAMLGFTVAASRSREDVIAATTQLAERLHIRKLKYGWLKPRLKKTQHELQAGPHTIEMWEVNESSQFGASPKLEGELAGTFLLVVVTVEGQGVFVGSAFVTKPDGDEHAGAVMESLQTFRAEAAENTGTTEKEAQGEPDK